MYIYIHIYIYVCIPYPHAFMGNSLLLRFIIPKRSRQVLVFTWALFGMATEHMLGYQLTVALEINSSHLGGVHVTPSNHIPQRYDCLNDLRE